MTLLIPLLIGLVLGSVPLSSSAAESIRAQEIAQCQRGEVATWGDGEDRAAIASLLVFAYDPAAAPVDFPERLVSGMVTKAVAAWSQCGVRTQVIDRSALSNQAGAIVIRWDEKESRGNFGLANLGQRTLALGSQAFALLKARNPAHDSRETLQMVISHEIGHFFGLVAHSRRCVDVLSYYDNARGEKCFSRDAAQMRQIVEYRSILPTACDIERCRKANGVPALPDGRLGR